MSGKLNLATFAAELLERTFDGLDSDGDDVQRMAEKHGLITRVPFDPEKHYGEGSEYCETGDDWYEYSAALKKAIAKATPSPSEALGG